MKAAPFDYVLAESVDHACTVLAEAGGGAQIIAGGQTLMPLLALRMSQPFILVDINRIEALKGVSRVNGATRIGPITRQNAVIADANLQAALPTLTTAARHIGHHQTRNRGTIGGSISLGEPAAEMPATAVALGATFEVSSVRGTRTIRADQFYHGPYATDLEPDELLTAIDYPDWPTGSITLFREVAQRPGDFALVGLVGCLTAKEGRIDRAGLAWFGMGPTPIKAVAVEQALTGQDIEALDIDALAAICVEETAPFDDAHATADYRHSVARRIFARTFSEALDRKVAA